MGFYKAIDSGGAIDFWDFGVGSGGQMGFYMAIDSGGAIGF
jgi:hypothetical protein